MDTVYNISESQMSSVLEDIDGLHTNMLVALLSTICLGESSPDASEQWTHFRAKQYTQFALRMRLRHSCGSLQIQAPFYLCI